MPSHSLYHTVIVTFRQSSHSSRTTQLETRRWSIRYNISVLNISQSALAVCERKAVTSRQSHHSWVAERRRCWWIVMRPVGSSFDDLPSGETIRSPFIWLTVIKCLLVLEEKCSFVEILFRLWVFRHQKKRNHVDFTMTRCSSGCRSVWATNECGVNCLDAECSPLQFSDFNHLSKSPLVKIVVQPLHFFPIHVWSIIHGVSKAVGRTVSSLSLIDTSQIQFWKHSIFLLYRGSLV